MAYGILQCKHNEYPQAKGLRSHRVYYQNLCYGVNIIRITEKCLQKHEIHKEYFSNLHNYVQQPF